MSGMTNPSQMPNIQNALKALQASEDEWKILGKGQHPAHLVAAHAARVQALTQAAAVHVLLDIADSLRTIARQDATSE